MSNFGTLTDYVSGHAMRPATAEEWRRTADVMATGKPDSFTGAWTGSDGRAVYVDGGPDAEVTVNDIRQLGLEAGQAGDGGQVALCEIALGDCDNEDEQDTAWTECARVILDNRANSVA